MYKMLLTLLLVVYWVSGFTSEAQAYKQAPKTLIHNSIKSKFRTENGAVQDLSISKHNHNDIRLAWSELSPSSIGAGLSLQGYMIFAAPDPIFECSEQTLIGITAYTEFIHQGILSSSDTMFYCVVAYLEAQMPANFVLVQGGNFNIGYQTTNSVTLASFYIDKYELTQGEYQRVMGVNPSVLYGEGENHPVYNVSWFNAIEYCNRRSIMEGLKPCYYYSTHGPNPNSWPTGWNTNSNHSLFLFDWTANGYRLPTEAEWEFAARGGRNTNNYLYSGSNTANDVAWTNSNSPSAVRQVGGKLPNELGLYDMSGNVAEWVWDISISDAYPTGPHANPTGVTTGANRVSRNGGWGTDEFYSSFYYRLRIQPTNTWNKRGFRICRSAPNFVHVEGGTFHNGSSLVTVSDFYIDKFELTQDSFRILMGETISFSNGKGSSLPAYATNWFIAVEYSNRRSIAEGLDPCYSYLNYGTNPNNWPTNWFFNALNKSDVSCNWTANGYRLPTEAEWLYAGKGGALSNNYTYSGSNIYYDVAITGITAPKGVGIGIPNELGLYDMTGNVCEWVWDYFAELPSVPQFNPTGPEAGGHGTVKGGSYLMTNEMSTLVDRFSRGVHLGSGDGGFRLVRKAQ